MIDYISGKIVANKSTEIVLETNGIGYAIKVSLNTAQKMPPEGQFVTLKTYLHLRETGVQLFGFSDEAERELFLGLLGISGIGPKLAMTLLSGLSVEQIRQAIMRRDERALSSISGVGKKTAQRLIVELRDKIRMPEAQATEEAGITVPDMDFNSIENEAVLALMSLGYSKMQAERAVFRVQKKEPCTRTDELIRKSLQII